MHENMKIKHNIIAIRRDVKYSLDAEQKDKAILAAAIRHLGGDIKMVDESLFTLQDHADIYLSMGRLPQTLELLRIKAAEGALVINTPDSVGACSRKQITKLMRENGIVMPPVKGAFGYWLKRGDSLAQADSDVVFCENEEELALNKAEWQKRGIMSFVESAHVPGDLIKFYGVSDHFFRWYRMHDVDQGYDFDIKALQREAVRLAKIIGIDVFGGDCIVCQDGHFYLIDFNDWPSFARCKEEAAEAIAQLVKKNEYI